MLSNAINWNNEQDPSRFPHTASMYSMRSAVAWDHPMVQRQLGMADIIVFQRNVIFQGIMDSMDYWKSIGKIVVVDLDDHYPGIPPSNPAYDTWIRNSNELEPHPAIALRNGLRHAHALIAPNHVILEDWADTVPGYFWPNYPAHKDYVDLERKVMGGPDLVFSYGPLPEDDPDAKREFLTAERKNSSGKIVIGWGGSLSHIDSFYYSGVIPALARLMEEDPRVVFKFCGNEARLDFLLEKLPKEQVWRQIGVSPYDWPKVISTFDIGIAPMDMRPLPAFTGEPVDPDPRWSYDERRSWLKLVEYICAGVPFVATACQPYRELGRFGKLVNNGPDDDAEENWHQALKSRVDGLDHFREQGLDNRAYGMKKLTQEANSKRLIKLYVQIGEEAQAREGMRLPSARYFDAKTDEKVEIPEFVPRELQGDPLTAGEFPWSEETYGLATSWHDQVNLLEGDIDLGRVMEYSVVSRINQLYRDAAEAETEKEEENDQPIEA